MDIFVSRKIPESGLELLRSEGYNLDVFPGNRPIQHAELLDGVRGADGLLCLLTDEISRDVIREGTDLKVIANYAVGYDNICVDAATEQGILVTNTPGVLTRSTAELTWALIFATTRRVVEGDDFLREGKFNGWSPTLLRGLELQGRTLGILGAGRIGREVGRIGDAFGMNILYHSRTQKQKFEEEASAKFVNLEPLLEKSDVLTLHVPLTDRTEGLLGEEELQMMKEGAYLINTARGAVVDETALVSLLKEGYLAGAGLDVYENEPEVHPELPELDNVVLLPHIGSATHRTRDKMAEKAARNMIAGLTGEEPPDLLNPEAFHKHEGSAK